ncbi:MAG: hypothetical protein UW11_C0022G0027 [Parcubacteria group bacterium GW2011_GWA2_43_9b]|nr:MAG: hypothetical protein UW11_C0022G0027 [Parcubacteria group bacterium GW2011_GWA2_43_9b]
MTNQFFYPEDDDLNPKKSDDATDDGNDNTDEVDSIDDPDVDNDDLIDDGIEEGEEIK